MQVSSKTISFAVTKRKDIVRQWAVTAVSQLFWSFPAASEEQFSPIMAGEANQVQRVGKSLWKNPSKWSAQYSKGHFFHTRTESNEDLFTWNTLKSLLRRGASCLAVQTEVKCCPWSIYSLKDFKTLSNSKTSNFFPLYIFAQENVLN